MINNNKNFDLNSKSGRGVSAFEKEQAPTLTESQVRAIIREELIKNAYSGTPIVPRHNHDNTNSPRIPITSIVQNPIYSGSIDMGQGVITNGIPTQWANYYIPIPSRPTSIKFLGGALGVTQYTFIVSFLSNYSFTVTSANASVGDVYSNNGYSFTVLTTISGGTTLLTSGTGIPSSSGTLIKVSGSGDSSISFSSKTTFPNAYNGAVYSNNGSNFTVISNTTGGTQLVVNNATGIPSSSGTLIKVSGSGDDTIIFSSRSGQANIHAYITGQASLVSGYQYQPGTSNSVTAGSISTPFIQGSAAIIAYNTGISILRNSESYIVFASDSSNNIYAVARVYGYDGTNLIVQTALQSGWIISGTWIIS